MTQSPVPGQFVRWLPIIQNLTNYQAYFFTPSVFIFIPLDILFFIVDESILIMTLRFELESAENFLYEAKQQHFLRTILVSVHMFFFPEFSHPWVRRQCARTRPTYASRSLTNYLSDLSRRSFSLLC
jgi:hypothetical protein